MGIVQIPKKTVMPDCPVIYIDGFKILILLSSVLDLVIQKCLHDGTNSVWIFCEEWTRLSCYMCDVSNGLSKLL